MESPLDILSRAAGMVSRNHEVTSSQNSSISHNENQCRILKLALVSSNGHNHSSKSYSAKQTYDRTDSFESSDIGNGMDSDTPLDMSIKKPKRNDNSESEDSNSRGADDDKIKRKRPSVISYASHQSPNNVAGFDVDDHFKKSLGLEYYNSVFSNAKHSSDASAESSPVPTIDNDDKTPEDTKKTSSTKVILQSSDLENSVDDHFAKALGKTTWMKLQGL